MAGVPPAVEVGILPPGKTVHPTNSFDFIRLVADDVFRRAGSHGSTTAKMADARIQNSFPAINRARGAGLGYDHFREQREFRFQLFPNPDRDIFAGGVFEAGDFV